jgi:hypothetical protein
VRVAEHREREASDTAERTGEPDYHFEPGQECCCDGKGDDLREARQGLRLARELGVDSPELRRLARRLGRGA